MHCLDAGDALAVQAGLQDLLLLPVYLFSTTRGKARDPRKRTLHKACMLIAQRLQSEEEDTLPPALPGWRAASNVDRAARNAHKAKMHTRDGHIAKAAKALVHGPVADASDPAVQARLKAMFNTNKAQVPPLPHDAPPIRILPDQPTIARLLSVVTQQAGKAPGPSGWRAEYFKPLLASPVTQRQMVRLVEAVGNGELPRPAMLLLLASAVTPAQPKPGKIRPIAVGEPLLRLAFSYALEEHRTLIAQALQPHQFGIGVSGGVETVVHAVQEAIRQPGICALAIDFANAYGNASRRDALETLDAMPELSKLVRGAHALYSEPSDLLVTQSEGEQPAFCIQQGDGFRQGCPMGGLLYCLSERDLLAQTQRVMADCVQQPPQLAADAARAGQPRSQPQNHVWAVIDDVTLTGTPQQVIAGVRYLEPAAKAKGLTIQWAKCKAFWTQPEETPRDLLDFATDHAVQLVTSASDFLGAVIGQDRASMAEEAVQLVMEDDHFFSSLRHEGLPAQEAIILLRQSGAQRLNYLLRTTPPEVVKRAAQHHDDRMLNTVMAKCGLREEEMDAIARTKVALGLKHGGMGMRKAVSVSPLAYLSSVLNASAAIYAAIGPTGRPSAQLLGSIREAAQYARVFLPEDSEIRRLIPGAPPLAKVAIDQPEAPGRQQPADPRVTIDEAQACLGRYAQELPARSLQSVLTAAMETEAEWTLQQTLRTPHPNESQGLRQERRARLALHLSASAPHASHWLQATGHHRALQIPNEDYELCVRRLLGVKLPKQGAIPARCTCGEDMRHNQWHGIHCKLNRRTVVLHGHDSVVHLHVSTARRGGALARAEPTDLSWTNNEHPDGELVMGSHVIWFDATIRDPAAPSYANSDTITRLACAKAAVTVKDNKYTAIAQANGVEFIAAAYEATGAAAPQAVRLIKTLVRWNEVNNPTESPQEVRAFLTRAIAVAIQRRNALAIRTCLQRSREQGYKDNRLMLWKQAMGGH